MDKLIHTDTIIMALARLNQKNEMPRTWFCIYAQSTAEQLALMHGGAHYRTKIRGNYFPTMWTYL